MDMITLDLRPSLTLTDDQFAQICQHNRDLRFERTAQGELVIMAPTGGETGSRNLSLGSQLWQWNQTHKLGKGFDSSEKVDNVVFVVGKLVGIKEFADGGIFGGFLFVLIQNPF